MRALLVHYDDDSGSDGEGADADRSDPTVDRSAADTCNVAAAASGGQRSALARKRGGVCLTAASPSALDRATVDKKSRTLPPPPAHLLSRQPSPAASVAPTATCFQPASLLSDGRIRTFPHVEGNWATHVYVAVPTSPGLDNLLDECDSLLPTHLSFQRISPSERHLSLSRCVTLRHHQIQHFTHLLSTALSDLRLLCVPLPVVLHSLALYCNEQRTRSFAAVKVGAGEEELLRVLAATDGVMREMGLPTFYEQPELHVTYAWRLGDVWSDRGHSGDNQLPQTQNESERNGIAKAVDIEETSSGDASARDISLDRPTVASCLMEVSAVHCKVGNRLTIIPLKVKQSHHVVNTD